jgi:hypothetical protein
MFRFRLDEDENFLDARGTEYSRELLHNLDELHSGPRSRLCMLDIVYVCVDGEMSIENVSMTKKYAS